MGSRPASVAPTVVPSARVTVIFSSRWIVWCAVTTIPGRQMTPLDGMRRRAWMATIDGEALATAPARSSESVWSTVLEAGADAESDMGKPRTGSGAVAPGDAGQCASRVRSRLSGVWLSVPRTFGRA